jgi:hypothetical protein
MFATSQRFRGIGGERGFFTTALEVMKVPGLMLRQRAILNPLSSIMIAAPFGRNPE